MFVSTSVLISVPVAPTVYSKQAVPFLSPDVAGYVGPRIVSASSDISDEELGHILELRKDYGLNDAPTFVKSLYEEPRARPTFVSAKMLLGGIRFTLDEQTTSMRSVSSNGLHRNYLNQQRTYWVDRLPGQVCANAR